MSKTANKAGVPTLAYRTPAPEPPRQRWLRRYLLGAPFLGTVHIVVWFVALIPCIAILDPSPPVSRPVPEAIANGVMWLLSFPAFTGAEDRIGLVPGLAINAVCWGLLAVGTWHGVSSFRRRRPTDQR